MTDTATIYHNPRCSKSRAALELLKQRELDITVVEYLKTPIDRNTVIELLSLLQLKPRELMRRGESIYKELELSNDALSDDQLIDAIVKNPILLERPIVSFDGDAAIGRPTDNIIDLLDQ